MAGKRPPENAWVGAELERAGQIARQINADQETVERVQSMWQRAGTNSIVSTAAAYRIGDPPTGRLIRPNNSEGWEQECWAYYDSVGELHYIAGQNGRSVSQARLYIAKYDDDGIAREVEDGNAAAMSRDLLGGHANSSELKFALGVQGIVSGQSIITIHDKEGWNVYSDQDFEIDSQELKKAASSRTTKGLSPYKVDRGGSRKERLPAGTLVIHLWDRHPGRAWQVDSSTRPALPYLRELSRLDEYVQATLLSRIATAGILQIPQEAKTALPPGVELPEGADPLMHALATVGQANIQDPGSASAVVPVMLSMPSGERMDHLTLDYDLTSVVNEFRDMNLKRVAMSMDMAPETMTGFAGVKYSNAEFIQSESIRTHVVRRVAAIATALTKSYVVPALGPEYAVRWDLSELEVKPDKAQSAMDLYDRGEIDGDTLREETGLREGAPPEGDELLRQLAYRAVTVNPSLLPALAPLLGVQMPINVERADGDVVDNDIDSRDLPPGSHPDDTGGPAQQDDQSGTEPSDPTAPTLPEAGGDQPGTNLAPRGPQRLVSDALIAACDVVVCAALGRAGAVWRKRRRSRINATRDLDTQAIYLEHSITADRTPDETPREHAETCVGSRFQQVSRIAALHACNPECLQGALVAYVCDLIVERRPHHPAQLADVVKDCCTDGD